MKVRFLTSVLVAANIISCGKKSNSDEGTSGLPSELNVGCGENGKSNCFETGVTGLVEDDLLLSSDQGQLDTMLLFSYSVVGFPESKSAYYDANIAASGELAKILIPKDGMVGRIEGARKEIVDSVKAEGTIGKCADAPASGSFTTLRGLTAKWTTPVISIPGDHPKAANKNYDKAITVSWPDSADPTITYDGRLEIVCDYNAMAMMVATNINGVEKNRVVFFYDRDNSEKLYADMYINDISGKLTRSVDPLTLVFQMRGSDKDHFKAHVNRVGTNGVGNALGYRYAINADYSKPSISFYSVEVGTNIVTTEAAFLANANSTSSSVVSSVAPAQSSYGSPSQGCADSWAKKGQSVTSPTLCAGLDLTEGPVFFWDAAQKNSMSNLYSNGKNKMNAISK